MTSPEGPLHVAARLEDRVHHVVTGRLRGIGWQPTLVSYPGYGVPAAEDADGWVRVLARVLMAAPGTPERTDDTRGWRRFISPAGPEIPVHVTVGTTTYRVVSDRNGYLDVRLPVAPGSLRTGEDGWANVLLRVPDPDGGRPVDTAVAPVRMVPAGTTAGLVSDLDDTVIVTMLPEPAKALRNAFIERESARRPVPGMAALYRELVAAHPGLLVVYLSTGAWNTVIPMRAFLHRHGFPPGPMLMTDWGPTPTGWFRSGPEHKRTSLRRLLEDFPEISWLLVGDDGQHDPSIYAELREEHPDRVRGIALRELSAARQVVGHGVPLAPDESLLGGELPGDPVVARTGYGLAKRLRARGLLPEGPAPT